MFPEGKHVSYSNVQRGKLQSRGHVTYFTPRKQSIATVTAAVF